MNSLAVLQAAQGIIATAVADVLPTPLIQLGAPESLNGDALIYLVHDGYTWTAATNDLVDFTHFIQIRLLLRCEADPQASEATFLAASDAIVNALTAARSLGGAVRTATLKQKDGAASNDNAAYAISGSQFWRSRWWTLEALERDSFTFQ